MVSFVYFTLHRIISDPTGSLSKVETGTGPASRGCFQQITGTPDIYVTNPFIILLGYDQDSPKMWTHFIVQCKVDAPMAIRISTLVLEKVVATYVALIIIIIIISSEFAGHLEHAVYHSFRAGMDDPTRIP